MVVTEHDQVWELRLKNQELSSKKQVGFVQAWMTSMSFLPPPWVAASFFFHSFFCDVPGGRFQFCCQFQPFLKILGNSQSSSSQICKS